MMSNRANRGVLAVVIVLLLLGSNVAADSGRKAMGTVPQVHVGCSHPGGALEGRSVLIELVDGAPVRDLYSLQSDADLLHGACGDRFRSVLASAPGAVEDDPWRLLSLCPASLAALGLQGRGAGTTLLNRRGEIVFEVPGHHIGLADKIALLASHGVEIPRPTIDLERDVGIGAPIPDLRIESSATGAPASTRSIGDGLLVYFSGACAPCAAESHGLALANLAELGRQRDLEVTVLFAVLLEAAAARSIHLDGLATYTVADPVARLYAESASAHARSRAIVIEVEDSVVRSVRDLRELVPDDESEARR